AHRELTRVILKRAKLGQEHPRAVVKGAARFGERHAIAASIKQHEAKLRFQIFHRRENSGLGAAELFGRWLKAALTHHRVEALELEQGDTFDHRNILIIEITYQVDRKFILFI